MELNQYLYLFRVTDSRGFSGDRFAYRLAVRPAEPDFEVSLKGTNLTVNAGSGQSFSLAAERKDGFEGEISVSIDHLPTGFTVSTPLVIESGHTEASGTLHAALDAPKPTEADFPKWVPETDRLCYAVESQAGRQTSMPVWLHVRRPTHLQAAAR
jgi:hypothetical protein